MITAQVFSAAFSGASAGRRVWSVRKRPTWESGSVADQSVPCRTCLVDARPSLDRVGYPSHDRIPHLPAAPISGFQSRRRSADHPAVMPRLRCNLLNAFPVHPAGRSDKLAPVHFDHLYFAPRLFGSKSKQPGGMERLRWVTFALSKWSRVPG
jgi:hypothetical protein